MQREELLKLLWAIFIAEGHVRASVPFGWLKRRKEWKAGKISFATILKEVANELKIEHERWLSAVRARAYEGDFIRWLARVGYNANPAEWETWERNVRHFYNLLNQL
ncbi:MAG: hypothetical protein QXG57_06210 [Thermofilaceae archaeon]